jgi:hypothetical protein
MQTKTRTRARYSQYSWSAATDTFSTPVPSLPDPTPLSYRVPNNFLKFNIQRNVKITDRSSFKSNGNTWNVYGPTCVKILP